MWGIQGYLLEFSKSQDAGSCYNVSSGITSAASVDTSWLWMAIATSRVETLRPPELGNMSDRKENMRCREIEGNYTESQGFHILAMVQMI